MYRLSGFLVANRKLRRHHFDSESWAGPVAVCELCAGIARMLSSERCHLISCRVAARLMKYRSLALPACQNCSSLAKGKNLRDSKAWHSWCRHAVVDFNSIKYIIAFADDGVLYHSLLGLATLNGVGHLSEMPTNEMVRR